jgi:hypothetical protein
MKFALFQRTKSLKFERFYSLMALGTAFLGGNFEKSNHLTNKAFLPNGPDRSQYSDLTFGARFVRFLPLGAFLVNSRRIFFERF